MSDRIVAFRSREEIVAHANQKLDQMHRESLLKQVDELRDRIASGEVIGLHTVEFTSDPDDWSCTITTHPKLPTVAVIGAMQLAQIECADIVIYGPPEDEDEDDEDFSE